MFSEEVKKYVDQLILKIGSIQSEIIVPVKVEEYAKSLNCFPNVAEKIKRDGGFVLYGWSALEGEFLIEAERHAIWKSPSGELIDITPSTSGTLTTFFIPEDLIYTGQFIDNIRINKTDNKVVDDWIKVASLRSKIFNTASRNGDYITIPKYIEPLYFRYEDLNNYFYSYLINGGKMETYCFCNSSKPYNKCHSLTTSNDCKRDSNRIDFLEKRYSKK